MLTLTLAACAGTPPADLVSRDVVLARGQVEAALGVEAYLGTRAKDHSPTTLAPDVAYGVSDRVTVGVQHSARALSLVDSGFSLCIADHGCERGIYDEVGVDTRVALVHADGLAVAARGRFVSRSFDPWKPSLRLGALARWQHGRFAVVADPQLQLGLAARDRGNRDWLRVPLWLAVQPTCGLSLALRTGLDGELVTFVDAFQIPIALDLTVAVNEVMDVSVMAGFPNLGGPLNNANDRHAMLTVTWRSF